MLGCCSCRFWLLCWLTLVCTAASARPIIPAQDWNDQAGELTNQFLGPIPGSIKMLPPRGFRSDRLQHHTQVPVSKLKQQLLEQPEVAPAPEYLFRDLNNRIQVQQAAQEQRFQLLSQLQISSEDRDKALRELEEAQLELREKQQILNYVVHLAEKHNSLAPHKVKEIVDIQRELVTILRYLYERKRIRDELESLNKRIPVLEKGTKDLEHTKQLTVQTFQAEQDHYRRQLAETGGWQNAQSVVQAEEEKQILLMNTLRKLDSEKSILDKELAYLRHQFRELTEKKRNLAYKTQLMATAHEQQEACETDQMLPPATNQQTSWLDQRALLQDPRLMTQQNMDQFIRPFVNDILSQSSFLNSNTPGDPGFFTTTRQKRQDQLQLQEVIMTSPAEDSSRTPAYLVHLEKQHRGKLLEILLEQLREEIELRQKLTDDSLTPAEAAEIHNQTYFLDNDIKSMVEKLEHRSMTGSLSPGEMSNSQIKQLLQTSRAPVKKLDDHALDLEDYSVYQRHRPPKVDNMTDLKPMYNSKLASISEPLPPEEKARRHNHQHHHHSAKIQSGMYPEQAVALLKSPAFQKQLLNEVAQQIDLKRCKQKGAVSLEDSIVALEIKSMLQSRTTPSSVFLTRVPRRQVRPLVPNRWTSKPASTIQQVTKPADHPALEQEQMRLLEELCHQQKVLLDLLTFADAEAQRSPPVDDSLLEELEKKQGNILGMMHRLKEITVQMGARAVHLVIAANSAKNQDSHHAREPLLASDTNKGHELVPRWQHKSGHIQKPTNYKKLLDLTWERRQKVKQFLEQKRSGLVAHDLKAKLRRIGMRRPSLGRQRQPEVIQSLYETSGNPFNNPPSVVHKEVPHVLFPGPRPNKQTQPQILNMPPARKGDLIHESLQESSRLVNAILADDIPVLREELHKLESSKTPEIGPYSQLNIHNSRSEIEDNVMMKELKKNLSDHMKVTMDKYSGQGKLSDTTEKEISIDGILEVKEMASQESGSTSNTEPTTKSLQQEDTNQSMDNKLNLSPVKHVTHAIAEGRFRAPPLQNRQLVFGHQQQSRPRYQTMIPQEDNLNTVHPVLNNQQRSTTPSDAQLTTVSLAELKIILARKRLAAAEAAEAREHLKAVEAAAAYKKYNSIHTTRAPEVSSKAQSKSSGKRSVGFWQVSEHDDDLQLAKAAKIDELSRISSPTQDFGKDKIWRKAARKILLDTLIPTMSELDMFLPSTTNQQPTQKGDGTQAPQSYMEGRPRRQIISFLPPGVLGSHDFFHPIISPKVDPTFNLPLIQPPFQRIAQKETEDINHIEFEVQELERLVKKNQEKLTHFSESQPNPDTDDFMADMVKLLHLIELMADANTHQGPENPDLDKDLESPTSFE
ncbi:unnamed protein product [Notodromas monacha]|uniref:Uncharacterized protein n=1 Tax=Notodromas monacha TaxID=399045 RepID=A0A7R9BT04_9CRUS|nr:unnamed protein product [Notodromas monacha]CAG0920133.1 unnamed protein product [Notodromas monacha]